MPEEKTEKPWKCPACGAELGRVIRNSSRIRQLHVGNVVLTGEGDVRCSCGAVRSWVPGEEALRELLAKINVQS